MLAMQLVIRDECLNSEMLNRLTTIIVDQLTDRRFVCDGPFEKKWHPFSRDKSTARQHSLESTAVRVVLKTRRST